MSSRNDTHVAWTRFLPRQKNTEWIEIGTAKFEPHYSSGELTAHLQMKSMPIGGFDGYVVLSPAGVGPPALNPPAPQRPGNPSDEVG